MYITHAGTITDYNEHSVSLLYLCRQSLTINKQKHLHKGTVEKHLEGEGIFFILLPVLVAQVTHNVEA